MATRSKGTSEHVPAIRAIHEVLSVKELNSLFTAFKFGDKMAPRSPHVLSLRTRPRVTSLPSRYDTGVGYRRNKHPK